MSKGTETLSLEFDGGKKSGRLNNKLSIKHDLGLQILVSLTCNKTGMG